jgi:hypothetical protein
MCSDLSWRMGSLTPLRPPAAPRGVLDSAFNGVGQPDLRANPSRTLLCGLRCSRGRSVLGTVRLDWPILPPT